jgi:hypothetical protein
MLYLVLAVVSALTACGPGSPPSVTEHAARANSSAENEVIAILITQVESFPYTRLHIRLTNLSSNTLAFSRPSLPWAGPYSLELAASISNGVALPLASPIADFPASPPIELPPGASLEGTFDLTWRVSGIEEALARGPVRVRWGYPSEHPNFLQPTGIGPRIGGTIVMAPASLAWGAV